MQIQENISHRQREHCKLWLFILSRRMKRAAPRTTDDCVNVKNGGFLDRAADSDVGQRSFH